MISQKLIDIIKNQYRLDWNGKHGIRHWARVFEIGCRLAEQNGANLKVVQLFSIFHDARRLNEHLDPEHGPRGAELAVKLRREYLPTLQDDEFRLLCLACCKHTSAATHFDITVQTCFDSDRLDLGRVGTMPDPKLLCTRAAKSQLIIDWAYEQGVNGAIPNNILGGQLSL